MPPVGLWCAKAAHLAAHVRHCSCCASVATAPCAHPLTCQRLQLPWHPLNESRYKDPMGGYSDRCAATLLGWQLQYPAKSRLCIQASPADHEAPWQLCCSLRCRIWLQPARRGETGRLQQHTHTHTHTMRAGTQQLLTRLHVLCLGHLPAGRPCRGWPEAGGAAAGQAGLPGER